MAATRYAEGSPVLVHSLKKTGLVYAVLSQDRYRVAIGSLLITCRSVELSPSVANKPSHKPTTEIIAASSHKPPASIDLHGMTVDQATRAVEAYLNRAILMGLLQVKIVHGFGTGRVQSGVHTLLSTLSVVRAFRINDLNPGETDVYL